MEYIQSAIKGCVDIDLLLNNGDEAIEDQPYYEKYISLQHQVLLILMHYKHTQQFMNLYYQLAKRRPLNINMLQKICIESKNKSIHEELCGRFKERIISSEIVIQYFNQDCDYLLWLSERYSCDFNQDITNMLSIRVLSVLDKRIIFNLHKSLDVLELLGDDAGLCVRQGYSKGYLEMVQITKLNMVIDKDNADLLEVYLDLFPEFDKWDILNYICKQNALKCYRLIVKDDENLQGMLTAFTNKAFTIINHYSDIWKNRISEIESETAWDLLSNNHLALEYYAENFLIKDTINKIISQDNHSELHKLLSVLNREQHNRLLLMTKNNKNLHLRCMDLILYCSSGFPPNLYYYLYYIRNLFTIIIGVIMLKFIWNLL